MLKKTWIAAVIVIALLPLGVARAAQFVSNNNGDIIVPAGESHRNLYSAGQTVTVDANTLGDLAVAGQTVVINGNVERSLFAAGRTLNVRGDVGDHLRVAAEFVTISGHVSGDVMVAGSEITITKDAVVDGGVYGAATDLTIDGVVKGEVKASANKLLITGSTGSITAYSTVKLASTAKVNGSLTYHWNDQSDLSKDNGATVTGKTTFLKMIAQPNHFAAFVTFASLAALIGWIILGLLVIFLLSKQAQKVVDQALGAPAAAAGYGLAVLFLLPIIGVILAITIVGLPISFLIGLVWLLLITVGSLLGKITLGAAIYKLFTKNQAYTVSWLTLGIGIIASVLLGLVPVLGGLVKFVFLLLGVGALAQVFFSLIRPRSSSTPAQ